MNQQLENTNVRSTLETNYSAHIEFLCARPTIPVPMSDLQETMFWQEFRSTDDREVDIALEELECEYIDIDLEGLQ